MDLKLILPTRKYKQQILEFKNKLIEENGTFDGCGRLKEEDVSAWLNSCQNNRWGKNLPKGYVPATQFITVRKSDNKIIGMLQIRHELTDALLNRGGHIGYSISPDERNKGYGKEQLRLALRKCKSMDLHNVLITCRHTNTASRKCILANGGILEDTRYIEANDIIIERYWVEI